MNPVKFSVKKSAESKTQEKPNPQALIEAVSILETKVGDLSKRAEDLLNLVASL